MMAATIDDPTKDSADIAAVLNDRDLTVTKRFIQAARNGRPGNPARALKLLQVIATRRPAEGLFADAAGFEPQDRTHILAVAALERNVEQAAALLLLAGIEQQERQEVVRTFARQRQTSDVARLISYIKPDEGQPEEDRMRAAMVGRIILAEFAHGADGYGHGGRPAGDIVLLYVYLIGAGCGDEADGLLMAAFAGKWPAGLANAVAKEFDHFMPADDVLAEWARRCSEVEVMAELLTTLPHGRRQEARMAVVGDQWKPKYVLSLCQRLDKNGQSGAALELRRSTLSRPDPAQVAEAVAAWLQAKSDRDTLLREAAQGRRKPRTASEIGKLAELLQKELVTSDTDVCDRLRKLAPVDECSGCGRLRKPASMSECSAAELVKLLGEVAEGRRRDTGVKFAKQVASAARERRANSLKTVACYLSKLRQQNWKGSRTAANSMVDELVDGVWEARVLAPVGVLLLRKEATRKDGETVLRGYLNKENAISANDVVRVFRYTQLMEMQEDTFIQGLAQATVGRWRPARRNEAASALRDAGLSEVADQVRARR